MDLRSRCSVLGLVVSAISACAAPESIGFPAGTDIVWPAAPDAARIQFVAEFSAPSDLGIERSMWGRMLGVVAGREDQGMVRPMAVAATVDGNVVYVADPELQCVHRFDLSRGRYVRLFADNETAMTSPVGLAVAADGRVLVADSASNTILTAGPKDRVLQTLELNPAPSRPTGIAMSPAGDLFVTNTANHSIGRYDAAGKLIREYGSRGTRPGQLNYPTYLWLSPPSELLVTDTMNFRVQRFDADDGLLGFFGEAGNRAGRYARPKGVAMDRHGHIYVVDGQHHAFHIYDQDGRLLLDVGRQGQGPGEFWLPSGIFVTSNDLILVADSYNRRVQVFRYVGDGP